MRIAGISNKKGDFMKRTLTAEEMIDYITLNKVTPETVRRVAAINALLAEDEALRRRMAALEALYDQIAYAPTEERRAFLLEAARNDRKEQQRG